MTLTGKMHGYMRMYWERNFLNGAPIPKALLARQYTLTTSMNWTDGIKRVRRYPLVLEKHDRAWSEREIYGKVRYMNSNGLKGNSISIPTSKESIICHSTESDELKTSVSITFSSFITSSSSIRS